MNATTAEWFRTKGRHKIYAGGKSVPLTDGGRPFVIPLTDVTASVPAAAGADARSGCGCH